MHFDLLFFFFFFDIKYELYEARELRHSNTTNYRLSEGILLLKI